MLKKSILIATLLTAVTSPSWGDGFYAGVGLGRDTGDFDSRFSSTFTDNSFLPPLVTTGTMASDASGTGFLASIFAGYGMTFSNNFYLAGEVDMITSSLEHDKSAVVSIDSLPYYNKTKYSLDHSMGISILPGYKITNNTLIYGRLGYVRGDFDVNSSIQDINNNTVEYNDDTGLNGIKYGLGIETSVYKNVGLRLEYDHISYAGYSSTVSYPSPTPSVIDTLKVSPSTDQVELAVDYRFG